MEAPNMYDVEIVIRYRVRVQANSVEGARERGVETWFNKSDEEKMALETNFDTNVTEEIK